VVGNRTDLRYEGNICIAGLTASGKTTHALLLAGEFGLTYVSASQIFLNFLGVSPIQPKDFWLSEQARHFWQSEGYERIDSELLRLEQIGAGYVFDTSTMPWRHQRPAFSIWLESSVESRQLKSIISHRGRSQIPRSEYLSRIQEKDRINAAQCKHYYGIEIGSDYSCFDFILDVSGFIQEDTLQGSLCSISAAHEIIRPAVGYYLTQRGDFRDELIRAVAKRPDAVKRNSLLDSDNCG
jgi:cytidylate kinase